MGRGTIKKLSTNGQIIELGESQMVSEEDLFIQKILQNNILKTDFEKV